jgi:hypothetical protein
MGATIVIAGLSHQGYRYRSGRRTVFGTRGGTTSIFSADAELREEDEIGGAILVDKARRDAGLPPLDPHALGGGPGGPATPLPSFEGGITAFGGGQGPGMSDDGAGWALQPGPAPGFPPRATWPAAPATTPVARSAPQTAPAGWYPDPENPGRQRYWWGNAWAPPTPAPPAS